MTTDEKLAREAMAIGHGFAFDENAGDRAAEQVIAAAHSYAEALRAENERLRAALESIANPDLNSVPTLSAMWCGHKTIARAALSPPAPASKGEK